VRPPFPFVVARGRSGTTLLRAILDSHSDLAIPGESHFPIQFAVRPLDRGDRGEFRADAFVDDLLNHWAFRRWGLPEDEVRASFQRERPASLDDAIRLAYAIYARRQGKGRFGDKTPSFVIHIDRLALLFPEARFVHLIRDGRDVALSYLDADFGAGTLPEAAIYWDRYVRRGRESGARLGPSRYLEVRYENLVDDPEGAVRSICTFLDLSFEDEMMRYFERIDPLYRSLSHREHHSNLYLPPTKGLRDWRRQMPPRDLAIFESIAGDLLDELGYERAVSRPSVDIRVASLTGRIHVLARRAAHRVRRRRHPSRAATRKKAPAVSLRPGVTVEEGGDT
jgi:hypothetical protein